MSIDGAASNVWSIPVTYSTFVPTGINTSGYAETGPNKIGAANFYENPVFAGNVQYETVPTPGLPDYVPGMRFFVVGDWPEPHVVCHHRSDDTVYCEGAPGYPNMSLQRGGSSMHAYGGNENRATGEVAVNFGVDSTLAVELQLTSGSLADFIFNLRLFPWRVIAGAWVGEPPTPSALYASWDPLKLTHVAIVYPSSTAITPPLRQHPRSDGLGFSSTRRVWPPSRSVQRSLRQGPGAYL